MVSLLSGTARDLGRLHDIASVFVRYGFGDAVRRLGMAGALERAGKILHWTQAAELARFAPPERVRHALQDLGPTFIKLGQILATRVDLFPPEWIDEFEKLQDRAPPAAFGEVRAQIFQDLGVAPEDVFPKFDSEPIAAGSIAQVHRAELPDGAPIAVKVRRPGIRPIVEADLRLLARLARILETEFPTLAHFRPSEVVRQFTLTLRRELDLAAECRNAERVAQSFREHPEIVVPRVYWDWTGERMNVQAYIEGIASRDLDAVDRTGLDRLVLARRGAQAVLKMVLEDGFFHADPHPGNVFYLPENRIAFIDFGMVGHLPERRRDELSELLNGLVERDSESVVDVLLDWAGAAQVDAEKLGADIDGFIDRYHGVPLNQLKVGDMLADMTALLRDHELFLPPDLALVLKVGVTLEATGRALDPAFDMAGEAAPFLHAAVLARRGPAALAKRSWRALAATLEIFAELPQDLRRMLRSARSGRLQVHVDLTRLSRFGNQLDQAASRLTLGVVVAALIIGSSIVMTIEGGPTLLGLPVFGLLGFLGAAAGGVWLLYSIWRSGRGE
jgi:ubiquinone biosynthesis protein